MHFKYLIISGFSVRRAEHIQKADLVRVKMRVIDHLINIEDMQYFDAEANEWKEISAYAISN